MDILKTILEDLAEAVYGTKLVDPSLSLDQMLTAVKAQRELLHETQDKLHEAHSTMDAGVRHHLRFLVEQAHAEGSYEAIAERLLLDMVTDEERLGITLASTTMVHLGNGLEALSEFLKLIPTPQPDPVPAE